MGRVLRSGRRCVWGEGLFESAAHHAEVYTAADNEHDFDPQVLGPTPNDYQYGYCSRCKQPMRWSVTYQRWLDCDLRRSNKERPPDHPFDTLCTGIAATYCEVHGTCICGYCCPEIVRTSQLKPVQVFHLEGATVEVGVRFEALMYELTDPHCPLHGIGGS